MRKSDLINEEPRLITINSFLARFYRKILRDLNITPGRFLQLAKIWSDRTKQTSHKKKIHISQIINKLTADSITWKTFIFGIFNILNVKKMEMIVRLHHRNGGVTEHKMDLTYNIMDEFINTSRNEEHDKGERDDQ